MASPQLRLVPHSWAICMWAWVCHLHGIPTAGWPQWPRVRLSESVPSADAQHLSDVTQLLLEGQPTAATTEGKQPSLNSHQQTCYQNDSTCFEFLLPCTQMSLLTLCSFGSILRWVLPQFLRQLCHIFSLIAFQLESNILASSKPHHWKVNWYKLIPDYPVFIIPCLSSGKMHTLRFVL